MATEPLETGPASAPATETSTTEADTTSAPSAQPAGSTKKAKAPTAAMLKQLIVNLRAERDILQQRLDEAEERALGLADEVAVLRWQATQPRAQDQRDESDLGIFARSTPLTSKPSLAADGSDPGVLPMGLTGLTIVAAMVTVLAFINQGALHLFTLVMVGLTLLLGYAAWTTRVTRVEVRVQRGVVYVDRGGEVRSFDLRTAATEVEVTGKPTDEDWQVTLTKRTGDPETITARIVDPQWFTAQLHEHRPRP